MFNKTELVMGMEKKQKRVESTMEDLVIDDGAGDGHRAGEDLSSIGELELELVYHR